MEQELYSALVVDDNPISLLVIENLLKGLKMKVTTAAGGKEALEKITSMEYDIVFMDHLMPEMNGIETLHFIRSMKEKYYQNVPVVVLTANETEDAKELFLVEGFQEFIQKPVKSAVLESVLNRFLVRENAMEEEPVSVEEVTTETTEEWKQILMNDGLDVKTALLYCNGKESYLDILREYCRIAGDTESELQQKFTNRDWGNYTISVHGIKSAMRSIGAMELSEEAKQLEAASKEGREQYILEHHQDFLIQYRNLFLRLQANALFGKSEKKNSDQENINELQTAENYVWKDLGEEEFSNMIDDMEEAVYAFELERFLEFSVRLKEYRYKGKPLQELSEILQRKIQRADYLSAVGVIKQWKKKW